MTKDAIVDRLKKKFDLKKNLANEIYDEFISSMKYVLIERGECRLHGFGRLKVTECQEKKYRNPQTGCEGIAPPTKRCKFSQFKSTSNLLNKSSS